MHDRRNRRRLLQSQEITHCPRIRRLYQDNNFRVTARAGRFARAGGPICLEFNGTTHGHAQLGSNAKEFEELRAEITETRGEVKRDWKTVAAVINKIAGQEMKQDRRNFIDPKIYEGILRLTEGAVGRIRVLVETKRDGSGEERICLALLTASFLQDE